MQQARTLHSSRSALAAEVAPALSGVVQQFKLADIGEGIAEVTLTEWMVKVGDEVKEMDNLCVVESDKATVELTSPFTGKVQKLYANAMDVVKVGGALVDIETKGSAKAAPKASSPQQSAPSAPPAAVLPTASAVQEFKLADIGEGIAEVTLTEWFVKEGDTVKEMDNLCSVESDKASVELTSPFTGKVKKVHHAVGGVVKVGATLVEIETASAPAKVASSPSPQATPSAGSAPVAARGSAPSPTKGGTKAPGVLATPKVRALAREKGIDLSKVTGTGNGGRVTADDLVQYEAASSVPAPAAKAPSAPVSTVARVPARSLEDKVVHITDNVGKGMVKSMNESLHTPYMALGEEIDVTDMLSLQKNFKDYTLKKYGTKVTLTSFMVKAMSLALMEHPKINSKFGPADANPSEYTVYGSHNISVAIDTPHGLMVPNIKDVGNLSVVEIQQEVLRLAAAANAGKLALSDIKGGTITLSNIGVIGTKSPRPILFDGQAVIGAAGRMMRLPRYNEKMEVVPRDLIEVQWVGDHRHLDGASLARFSNSFKRYMEEPGEWLLTLK
jgi:2-oxoisovalerate dehydrogenase E2 component (dihydrolipoyl transacylase)